MSHTKSGGDPTLSLKIFNSEFHKFSVIDIIGISCYKIDNYDNSMNRKYTNIFKAHTSMVNGSIQVMKKYISQKVSLTSQDKFNDFKIYSKNPFETF